MMRALLRPVATAARSFLGLSGLTDRLQRIEIMLSILGSQPRAELKRQNKNTKTYLLDIGSEGGSSPAAFSGEGAPRFADRKGSLTDLDRLNAEYADRPVRERTHAVGKFVLDIEASPLTRIADAFSADYYNNVSAFWEQLSGRNGYDPRRDELVGFLDFQKAILSPSFYSSADSRYVGEFLCGIGQILQVLDVRSGDRVLEYGPGEGQIAMHLLRMGCHVAAIDVEQRYLDAINAQAASIGAHISTKQGLFGDVFKAGETFDRILFFEAFHHALDHASILRQLRKQLSPGGRIVLAAEPVIDPKGPWAAVVPYAWGPRLDGLSVNATRIHGWCELGFREDYFAELLMRSGYLYQYRPFAPTPIGVCHVAIPHAGVINMGEEFVIRVCGADSGWHPPESNLRWTNGHGILPLDTEASAGGVILELYNFIPVSKEVTFRTGTISRCETFAPGESRSVHLTIPSDAVHLEIICNTQSLASYVGAHDQRVVGIAVRRLLYPGYPGVGEAD